MEAKMDDALTSEARWHAVVSYRTDAELLTVEFFLTEIEDLHDRIETGPHWDTVELIQVRRINPIFSEKLTLDQAEDLGRRTAAELFGHLRPH